MSQRCSTCHTLIDAVDAQAACNVCAQVYHRSCWDELGGCATYGCTQAAEAAKPAPTNSVGTGWGDSKVCPNCTASISSGLLRCRCGAEFPYADPMTRQDYGAWQTQRREGASVRRWLLVLFVASLTGVLAPFTGAAAAYIARRNRKRLEGADGTYLAMGYGAAALGATYALTALLLILGM